MHARRGVDHGLRPRPRWRRPDAAALARARHAPGVGPQLLEARGPALAERLRLAGGVRDLAVVGEREAQGRARGERGERLERDADLARPPGRFERLQVFLRPQAVAGQDLGLDARGSGAAIAQAVAGARRELAVRRQADAQLGGAGLRGRLAVAVDPQGDRAARAAGLAGRMLEQR